MIPGLRPRLSDGLQATALARENELRSFRLWKKRQSTPARRTLPPAPPKFLSPSFRPPAKASEPDPRPCRAKWRPELDLSIITMVPCLLGLRSRPPPTQKFKILGPCHRKMISGVRSIGPGECFRPLSQILRPCRAKMASRAGSNDIINGSKAFRLPPKAGK